MGLLFVVSAPSGAGKTTLCRGLLARQPEITYSVSYTTRPPRPGEINGRDYHFISRDEFTRMIQAREFLEWAEVFGRYYGTGRAWVQERLDLGLEVLADVDVVGARQIKGNRPEAILIFILTPSLAELERRLRLRRTETQAELDRRLAQAKTEIEAAPEYDYLIINDEVDRAVSDLVCVVQAERLKMSRAKDLWTRFLAAV
ncbi:MAG: guanylate kinase [Thermodesulfobacteriota bacterium]